MGGALLLHGLALVVLWRTPGPTRPAPGPGAAPAMVWVAIAPPPSPSPSQPSPSVTPGARSAAVASRPVGRARSSAPAPEHRAPPASAGADVREAPAALVALPAPLAPASRPEGPPPAPGLDDVARVLQRERAWQRRQGALSPQRWEVAPAAVGAALGADAAERDLRGADGRRTVEVTGPWGTYCVELPSANQPPAMGAAPRIAPARTCR
ncbi:hypothetical protein DBV10_16225 [Acidovorax sp. FJL06]|nr:hypothetical protein DBV10_16225 [Acidovorax sp. FJL06]